MEPDSLLALVAEIIRAETGDAALAVTPATDADDADGWDSLAHARIIVAIEDQLGIHIPDRLLFDLTNVGDLLHAIDTVIGEGAADGD